MHFIKKEFITFNDNLYYTVKVVKMEDNPNVEAFKEYLQADIVLKKEDKFYFLRNIPDIEVITEEN